MIKKIKTKLEVLGLIGLIGFTLAGCATAPDGDTNAKIRREVALWSEDIASLALIAKPEYRPAIEAAVRALDAAETSEGISLNSITAALGQVDSLQSKDSKLALIGGRLLLRRAFGSNLTLETPELINAAGLGLRDGLKAALAVP